MEFVHVELKRDSWVLPKVKATNPDAAIDFIRGFIGNLDREMVISLNLASSGRIINASIVSIGSMDASMISPAEILRTALVSGAKSIILIHNHPSGNVTPSKADLSSTKRLATACAIMEIPLLDHIIIGDEKTYSVFENHPDTFISGVKSAAAVAEPLHYGLN